MSRKLLSFLIILISGLFVSGFSLIDWWTQDGVKRPAFSIGEETTKVTSHLDENGFVNYVDALNDLNQLPVTLDNNFALVLWDAIGVDSVPEKFRKAFFEPISFDYLATPENALVLKPKTKSDAESLEKFLSGDLRLWRKGREPGLIGWMNENDKALDRIKDATNRSQFTQTYLSTSKPGEPALLGTALYGISEMQQIARMFAARAMVRQRNGNLTAALDDAFTCRQLGRYLLNRHTEVEVKVGFEICELACKCEKRLVNDSELTLEQANSQLKRIADTPLDNNFVNSIDKGARWSLLDLLQLQTRKASKRALVQGRIEFDDSFKTINKWYDRGITAINSPTHELAQKKLDIIYEDLTQLSRLSTNDGAKKNKNKGVVLGNILVGQMFSDLRGQYLLMSKTQVENRLVLLGYGARIFAFRQGKLPESLEELSDFNPLLRASLNSNLSKIELELDSKKLRLKCKNSSLLVH